jgi:hypothetical protein
MISPLIAPITISVTCGIFANIIGSALTSGQAPLLAAEKKLSSHEMFLPPLPLLVNARVLAWSDHTEFRREGSQPGPKPNAHVGRGKRVREEKIFDRGNGKQRGS